MRPVCEAFGEGIEKKNGNGQRSEFESERIELPSCDEKQSHGCKGEEPREGKRESAGCERALFRSRILPIEAKIGDAVHGHRGRPRRNHGDHDPQNLAKRRPAIRRLMRGTCSEKGSRQRKGKRKDGVLKFDHLQHGADAASHREIKPPPFSRLFGPSSDTYFLESD